MRRIHSRHRYFEWDGSRATRIDLDDALQQLADDVAEYGDLNDAFRRMMSRGLQPPDGGQRRGLSHMMRMLRERQNEQLRRYDLSSVMRDFEKQLEEIEQMERDAIQKMRDELGDEDELDFAKDALRSIANKHENELNDMPTNPSGKMNALKDYEFLDPEAQKKYQKLVEQLRNAVTDSLFKNLSDQINNMSPEDMQRMKDMMKALNEMLTKKIAGEKDQGFDEFMNEFGDMFGDNPPESLDELLHQMQQQMAAARSLLWSMSRSQREELSSMLNERFDDPELVSQMNQLRKELEYLLPPSKSFGFRGEEELDLAEAQRLLEQMNELEQLKEQLLTADRTGDLEKIDRDLIKEILGEDIAEELVDLQRLREMLKDAGLIRESGEGWELTPMGARKLGFKALAEIYARLRQARLGTHATPEEGRFGDRQSETKAYEFGDPLHLDLPKTLSNAIVREGPKTPVKLAPDDFEIHRSELQTATHTVMCVDLSTSMAMRGAFRPAKKVALALQHLITSQYPHDSFYVIGFDVLAREVKPHDLLYLRWDEYMTGTNMEHALLLSEKLLSKHQGGSRQIILISDGEPTVRFVNGRTQFNYPPTRATLQATYRAVQRCTKSNIAINTFMLDADGYFANFIDEVTRINGGRVFYTNPRRLGEYVLVDYLTGKRRKFK